MDIHICYNHNEQVFNVQETTPINNIFDMAQSAMEIEGNIIDYYFYFGNSIQIIDSRPISSIIGNNNNTLFLISKNDYAFLDNYLKNISPSLVATSAEFCCDTQRIINVISSLHRFIANFSLEDVMLNVYSIIPVDRFDELDGDAKVIEITKWFKEEFFTYVKDLKCHNCGSETQRLNKAGGVSKEEAKHLANQCELYYCNKCGATTRFPRYNDISKLIETRKGRCGEFSNMLAAILKASGYDIRLVADMNDYLWIEYWSDEKGRYVHIDPIQNIIDQPLMYEEKMGKKHTWIIAVGEGQCADVTQKYTKNIDECIRRRSIQTSEEWYFKYIKFKNDEYVNCIEDVEERKEIQERQHNDSEIVKLTQ
ncbi:peptide-N4-(N-acetyl-beta- glucosaminyl)asparagine amidase [Tritrichomonas musculus]|uniref:Peptide-N4-(N-acetyl-beta-glucosaminyl)asparagine amidase n=1 Tax=Tritrichomonas musculus TaxID=1915356 RepID=A0ABR2K0V4_9EUKA